MLNIIKPTTISFACIGFQHWSIPQLYIEVASHWLAKLNLVNEVLIHGYYTVKDQGVHIFTELGQLQLESIHSKMLSHAAQER